MMIMKWCNVQTNEYDLQAHMNPTICTHQKYIFDVSIVQGLFFAHTCNDPLFAVLTDSRYITKCNSFIISY